MSGAPPGGNPFTNMIGWVGQLCAIAGMLLTNSAAGLCCPSATPHPVPSLQDADDLRYTKSR